MDKYKLTMEEIAKISGGEIDPRRAQILYDAIRTLKIMGVTKDDFIERASAFDYNQEALDFMIENWYE